jgi:Ca-activated chloride channel family protein
MGSNEKVVLGYDWYGNAQYAELDEEALKEISDKTGGTYFKSIDNKTLDNIYDNISKDIKREKEKVNIKDYFFLLAIILFLMYLYLRYGSKRVIQ